LPLLTPDRFFGFQAKTLDLKFQDGLLKSLTNLLNKIVVLCEEK